MPLLSKNSEVPEPSKPRSLFTKSLSTPALKAKCLQNWRTLTWKSSVMSKRRKSPNSKLRTLSPSKPQRTPRLKLRKLMKKRLPLMKLKSKRVSSKKNGLTKSLHNKTLERKISPTVEKRLTPFPLRLIKLMRRFLLRKFQLLLKPPIKLILT